MLPGAAFWAYLPLGRDVQAETFVHALARPPEVLAPGTGIQAEVLNVESQRLPHVRIPVIPGVPPGMLLVDVGNAPRFEKGMKLAILLDQEIFGAAVEGDGWQAARVDLFDQVVNVGLLGVGQYAAESLGDHLGRPESAGVSPDGGEPVRVFEGEPQRPEPAHRKPADGRLARTNRERPVQMFGQVLYEEVLVPFMGGVVEPEAQAAVGENYQEREAGYVTGEIG